MTRKRTRVGALIGVVVGLSLAGVTVAAWPVSATTTAARADFLTSPTLDRVKSSGKLRACIDPEFLPEVYLKKNEPAGFDVAITKELAAGLGVDVEWVQTNFDGLIAGLQAGKCDISLSGMTPRGKRALAVTFAKPTLAASEGVIVHKSEKRATIAALNNPSVRFCDQTGTGSEFDQKKYFPKAKATLVPSADACLLQVLAGKTDAVITDTVTGNGWVKAHPKELKLVLTDAGLPAAPTAAAVQLGDFAFAAYIDVFFGEWINNGNYEPTFRREMGYEPDMGTLMRQRGNF